jgi:proteic killer suppression protein
MMEVEFNDDSLERLEWDATFDAGWSQGIVRAFRKLMNMIRNAPDERIFINSRGIRFEKLKGKERSGQYSMRLNDQYRLIVRFKESAGQKVVIILTIEDYH